MYSDIDKLRLRTLTKGVNAKFYNEQVKQRYEGNSDLLEACTIYPFETLPEITAKQFLFYFVLENYTPQVKEKIYLRNKPKGSKPVDNLPWATIHLKFAEKYVKDPLTGELKPSGQRQIHLSNVNLDLSDDMFIKALSGLTLTYGSSYTTYNYRNGKELRLEHVSSSDRGITLLEKFVPLTLKEHQQEGAIDENVFIVTPPKRTPKVLVHGMTGYVCRISFHEQQGNKTVKLKRLLIPNKAKG